MTVSRDIAMLRLALRLPPGADMPVPGGYGAEPGVEAFHRHRRYAE